MLGNLFADFFGISFCEKFFQEYTMIMRVPNSLLVDQARQNAGPDLSPNCLQWLSADSAGM